jgi:hypothetical protein
MSRSAPQNLQNHVRFDPPFHAVLLPILLLNLVIAVIHNVRHPGVPAAWFLVMSIAAILALFKIRQYPMKVQDRVIRLEERLRLHALVPGDWRPQIARLTEDQLIGLRFASDEEVAALARQALDENLTRKQIKERIKNWRADDWRV